MTRILLPSILLIAAIGLFVIYTDPTYQNIKNLEAQQQQYNAALTQSSQVRAVRDKLLAKSSTFPTDDTRRLERLLPDNVDNIRLIIDINDIAARYHLQVSNVSLSTSQGNPQGSVGGGTSPLGTMEITFSLAAQYTDFVSFLEDIEHSLRIIDVESVKFNSVVTGGAQRGVDYNNYTVMIKTYWLR